MENDLCKHLTKTYLLLCYRRLIDKNNDKFIDSNELMATLTSLGEPLSEAEVNAMIKVADVNKDGKIDYEGEEIIFFLSAVWLCCKDLRYTFVLSI